MDLHDSADTEEAGRLFDRLLRNECPPARVRAAEPSGFDSRLWAKMLEIGLPTLGVPVNAGGGGADLRTLAVLCESAGRALAPAPVVESMAAGRAATRGGADASDLADKLVALAVTPAHGGICHLVPGGAVAEQVIGLDSDELVMVDTEAGEPPANLGASPVADVDLRLHPRRVLAKGNAAREAFEHAVGEWKLLTAAALVGVAAEALRIGVAYVKERRQFGVPIGSFQALAHALADDHTAVEGARLLVREAAWSADVASHRSSTLAVMAFLFAGETAQKASADSLHFHGGYGFTLEYDIQMYFRRAKAWSLAGGGVGSAYEDLGTSLYGTGGTSGL